MRIRTYSDLRRIRTFEERFAYLSLRGQVGHATFGFDRWVNQTFYTSRAWRDIRQEVILRDEACDLGVTGYEISSRLLIHHMNPISVDDIVNFNDEILDLEFLITTTHDTHNAIHYGDESLLRKRYVERAPGDTKLW